MHKFVSFNHQITLASQTKLSAISSATFYGKGIFTTLAVYDSKPFLWEKHWRRLSENAFRINIDLTEFTEQIVYNSLLEIIAENKVISGRLRITFFDESASQIWHLDTANKTSCLITTGDLRKASAIKLAISPFLINSTSPLVNIKSCNYLENILALKDAKQLGFDEAVRINERGEIASACMANIFWQKDYKLFTPSLKTGCLAGTVRESIIENNEVFEVEEPIESLQNVEAIFLTSSGIGCSPVSELLGKSYQATAPPQLEPLPAVQPKQ